MIMGLILDFFGGPFVAALRKYWKLIVVAIAIGLVYLYWADRTHTIKEQAQEIVNVKVKLNTQELEFKDIISKQNAQILEFQKKSEEQAARMKEAADKLAEYRRLYNAGVITIINGPKPKDCQEAIDYLVNGSKELQWEKSK
jgi:regulator of replication initiation timing